MKRFRKRQMFVTLAGISLISLLFLGFGCGDGDHDYVPLAGGGGPETFTMTEFFPLTSSWETDRWTLFIDVRDHEVNGVMTRAMADTQFPTVYYWTNDENGLRIHAVIDEDGILYVLPAPVVLADAVCKVGDRQETTLTIEEEEIKFICELVGVEDITVPAGTFEGCLKFVLSGYPVAEGPEGFGSETFWLAKDVGFVKAVSDENTDLILFAEPGDTRQLLSYHITPSDLTADEQAIKNLPKQGAEYWEQENLDIIDLYSDDYKSRCRSKADRLASFTKSFANNEELMIFLSLGEIVVDGEEAHTTVEGLVTGISDHGDQRWWIWIRKSVHYKNEIDVWKFYGDQASFRRDWFSVRVRNWPEGGPSLQIGADLIDCGTGEYIDSPDVVASLTITGPPETSIDPDLKQDWIDDPYESWRGFWRSREDIANATNGFYTFRVVEDQTGNFFEFTDYLERMPLLDVPTLVYPPDGAVVPAGDVTLDWDPVDGADYYQVNMEYMQDSTWIEMDNINTTDTQVTVPNLPAGTDFHWVVRARQRDLYRETDNESITGWWATFSTSGE